MMKGGSPLSPSPPLREGSRNDGNSNFMKNTSTPQAVAMEAACNHKERIIAKTIDEKFFAEDKAARFWAKVTKTESCWIWSGTKHSNKGYGVFYIWNGQGQIVFRAHRYSVEYFFGPIDPSLTLDHLCENKLCVNPGHLEAVSNALNNQRKNRKNLNSCKYGHPLTDENIYLYKFATRTGHVVRQRKCKTCTKARRRRKRDLVSTHRVVTHCIRGHELSGDNVLYRTRFNKAGEIAYSRRCRTCGKRKPANESNQEQS